MPLVWALILFLTWGDLVEMWGMLLQRDVPPINPLYWDGLVVFLITIIPRMSLTVRRLHDSGKSGKWLKLPFITVTSGFFLVLGIFSAMVTSNFAGGAVSEEFSIMVLLTALAFSTMENAWDAIFGTVAVLNAMGWESIIALLSEWSTPAQPIDVSRGLNNVSNSLQNAPMEGGSILVVAILMIATPFVTAFLHIFFMISPTKPDHDLDSSAPIAGASLRQKGEISDNPFAGYKYLYDKSPEQEAAHKAAAKQEIKSLYQQRVLGQQQTS